MINIKEKIMKKVAYFDNIKQAFVKFTILTNVSLFNVLISSGLESSRASGDLFNIDSYLNKALFKFANSSFKK